MRLPSPVIERLNPPQSASFRPPATRPVSLIAHALLLVGAIAAVAMAGGPQQANLGAFLILAGGGLLACPPQARVDPRLCAVGGALVLSAALSFLPHGWLPSAPWRQALMQAGVPLGISVTPVPRETAFWLALLAITVASFLLALAHPLRSRSQLLMSVVVLCLSGAYVALAFFVQKTGWQYPFDANPKDFGFFLNRNHTATFLTTGSLAALGVLAIAVRSERWWTTGLAGVVLLGCVSGLLFFSTSRGGVLTLLGGIALWVIGLGKEHRTRPMVISLFSISVASGILFAASPGVVRERALESLGLVKKRVVEATGGAGDVDHRPIDARMVIFQDTLRMAKDFPLTGVGLGAFRPVFPFYNRNMPADTPISHPESDWLMLASEAGAPAILLLATAVALLCRQVWKSREHGYWPLRWGLLCAALAALAHGFIDVPAHRAALGWWVLAIGGLGFQIIQPGGDRPQRWLHGIFIVTGLGAILLGERLIRSDFSSGEPLPPSTAMWVEGDIIGAREGGHHADSVSMAYRATKRSPMAARLHFQYGVSLLAYGADHAEVDAAFRRERLLTPGVPTTPYEQGLVWAEVDPTRAVAVWGEALRLQQEMDARWPRFQRSENLYAKLIQDCAALPEVQRGLLALARGRPTYVISWITRAAREIVAPELPRLTADPELMLGIAPRERRFLLEQWYAHGDRAALFEFLSGRPDWQIIAAPLEWKRLADEGKYEEAVRGTARLHGVSLEMPPVNRDDASAAPSVPPDPLADFRSAWNQENTVAARRMLEEARRARPAPPEAVRLLAAWAVRDGQWRNAWMLLEEYLRAAGIQAPL